MLVFTQHGGRPQQWIMVELPAGTFTTHVLSHFMHVRIMPPVFHVLGLITAWLYVTIKNEDPAIPQASTQLGPGNGGDWEWVAQCSGTPSVPRHPCRPPQSQTSSSCRRMGTLLSLRHCGTAFCPIIPAQAGATIQLF